MNTVTVITASANTDSGRRATKEAAVTNKMDRIKKLDNIVIFVLCCSCNKS